MDRRSFLGFLSAPLFLPAGFNLCQDIIPLHWPSQIAPLRLTNGSTVEDITVSFKTPCDYASLVEFYRRSKPEQVLSQFALNHRGLFRWAAMPDMQIIILPGDVLEWRIAQSSGDLAFAAADINVWMLGRDLASGRAVVNQSEYLNA